MHKMTTNVAKLNSLEYGSVGVYWSVKSLVPDEHLGIFGSPISKG